MLTERTTYRGPGARRVMAALLYVCVAAALPAAAMDRATEAAVRASARPDEVPAYAACVNLLASPAMEGRGPGTRGAERARDYLVARFRTLKLAGAFAKGHTQTFGLRLGARAEEQRLRATDAQGRVARTLRGGRDFQALGFSASRSFAGPAVFVGYALASKQHEHDSFAGLPRDALKGKVAVAFRYEPQDPRGRSRWTHQAGQWTRAAGLTAKAELAARYGAAAVLIVNPPSHRNDPLHTTARTSRSRAASAAVLHVTTAAFERMLAAAGRDGAKECRRLQALADRGERVVGELAGLRLAGTVRLKVVRGKMDNVVAVLPGRGKLAGEVVVVGAHWDHLGRGGPGARGPTGPIYPGANDNASGTAGILALARRFVDRAAEDDAARRTILLACFGGEERGLIGSTYMAGHLSDLGLKASQVAAMVNMDMIGRLRDGRVSVWGVESGKGWRALVAGAGRGSGLKLMMSGGGYGPSDHASFYRVGVPVVCFSTGMFADLHRPTDTADKIDPAGAIRILNVVDRLVWSLATRAERIEYVAPQGGARRRRPSARSDRRRSGAGRPDRTMSDGASAAARRSPACAC